MDEKSESTEYLLHPGVAEYLESMRVYETSRSQAKESGLEFKPKVVWERTASMVEPLTCEDEVLGGLLAWRQDPVLRRVSVWMDFGYDEQVTYLRSEAYLQAEPTTRRYRVAKAVKKNQSGQTKGGFVNVFDYGPADFTSAQRGLVLLCARADRHRKPKAWKYLLRWHADDPTSFTGTELVKRALALSVSAGVDYTKPCTFIQLEQLAEELWRRGRVYRICVYQDGEMVYKTKGDSQLGDEMLCLNLQLVSGAKGKAHYHAISTFPAKARATAGAHSLRRYGEDAGMSAQMSLVILVAWQDKSDLWKQLEFLGGKKRKTPDYCVELGLEAKEAKGVLIGFAQELSRVSNVSQDVLCGYGELVKLATGLSLQRGHVCHIRVFEEEKERLEPFQTDMKEGPDTEWFNLNLSGGYYSAITKSDKALAGNRRFCAVCGKAYKISHACK
jgi:hypothetical protein